MSTEPRTGAEATAGHGDREPVLSVLTAGGPPERLVTTYSSLLRQSDPRWEWCVAVDRADLPAGLPLDPRIVPAGSSTAGAGDELAAAWAASTGRHVLRLAAGDELADDAVQLVDESAATGGWGYFDEAQHYPGGRLPDVWEKPDHSPELLLSQPYVARSAVLSRGAVLAAGGVDPTSGSAAWFEVVLKVDGAVPAPWHVGRPVVVRNCPDLTTRFVDGDPLEHARVVRAHCTRSGIAVRDVVPVVVQGRPVGLRVAREVARWPSVSIVIPTRGSSSQIDGQDRLHVVELVRSIRAADPYPGREIVVVADAETPAGVLDAVRALAGDEFRLVEYTGVFNFSRKCNDGAVASAGEYLCFLNDDMDVLSPDWLHEMVGRLEDPGIGAVGAQLVFGDDSLQHIGHHYVHGDAGHPLFGWRASTLALGAAAHVAGERSGVTAACVLLRRSDFEAVGGFSNLYPLNYNDVDLCLKLRERGRRIVYTPHARLRHYESQTRQADLLACESSRMRGRWAHRMTVDPYLPQTRPTTLRSKFLPPESVGAPQTGRGDVPVPAALDVITEDRHD